MKSQNPYTFFDQYCLRTPLLPLTFYQKLTEGIEISDASFKAMWKDCIIKEAIFLASSELFDEIDKWFTGSLENKQKIEGLKSSFLKYVARMSSRCTPFGLFAGCSIGHFSDLSNIELSKGKNNKRQTRFDMNFLVAFSQKLSKNEIIKKQLLWYPNNSMYKIGNQYRYIEYTYNDRNRREHSIEAVTYTPYLEIILNHAKEGKRITELSELLVDDDISIEDAEMFIEELINGQLLISEIEPSLTGDDFLEQLYQGLIQVEGTQEFTSSIKKFKEGLEDIDKEIGNTIGKYDFLKEEVRKLQVSFDNKHLFQTDFYQGTLANTLHKSWGYKIKRALPLLNRISFPPQQTNLISFRNAFLKRYETREIPLTTALDTEIGIGYLQNQNAVDSTPFLDDLKMPSKKRLEESITWNIYHSILNNKLKVVEANDSYTLEFKDEDFLDLPIQWNDLPDTMSTLVEIVGSGEKQKAILSSVGGSSAANLLGRFTTGDPMIYKLVKKIANVEAVMESDKIIAEIIHLPESRTGNILRREALRDYEIPYLGKSSLSKDCRIDIDDLMVSVTQGKVKLRSKKYNKEVIPKLSNAHNYKGGNSLPIYHFLCDIQHQYPRNGIYFQWGPLLRTKKFLPRVVYKDFILSKAQWTVHKNDIEFIEFENNTLTKVFDEIEKWRRSNRIPQWVHLIEGDNTLLINLKNKDSIIMWMDAVKRKKHFMLEEFLFVDEGSPVRRDTGTFCNQFVISLYNKEKLDNKALED